MILVTEEDIGNLESIFLISLATFDLIYLMEKVVFLFSPQEYMTCNLLPPIWIS